MKISIAVTIDIIDVPLKYSEKYGKRFDMDAALAVVKQPDGTEAVLTMKNSSLVFDLPIGVQFYVERRHVSRNS